MSDLSDTAIHHVRWRHTVAASLGQGQRHVSQNIDTVVISNFVMFDYSAVSAVSVGAEADICCDKQVITEALLQFTAGAQRGILRMCGIGSVRVLVVCHRKEHNLIYANLPVCRYAFY